ncbi:MAG: hypothetical protein FRX49_01412 [Trebouxia sp. A1-2]|nr:MAG: hypothetical protein FRX49_01412 [Trebouxia sp. A1-2]
MLTSGAGHNVQNTSPPLCVFKERPDEVLALIHRDIVDEEQVICNSKCTHISLSTSVVFQGAPHRSVLLNKHPRSAYGYVQQQVVRDGEELPVVAQQGCHGGAQHEGQLDQLMCQEVAVVVVQAGQLRHLHWPGPFQTNQQEEEQDDKKKRKEKRKRKRSKRRGRGAKEEEQGEEQGARRTEGEARSSEDRGQNSWARCPAWWMRREQKRKRQMETTNKLAKEEKEEDEEKKKSERRMKKGMKKGMRKVDEYQQIRQEACCDCRCTEPATLLAGPGLSFAEPHSRMEIIRKDAENCVESLALVHWCALLDKADKHMDSATRGIQPMARAYGQILWTDAAGRFCGQILWADPMSRSPGWTEQSKKAREFAELGKWKYRNHYVLARLPRDKGNCLRAGKQDGLYWRQYTGQRRSPAGLSLAQFKASWTKTATEVSHGLKSTDPKDSESVGTELQVFKRV